MDSSDEEWEAAYAALDPKDQIGWGNRRGQVAEVGANLVRDVFTAADQLHENAMSEMDGNSEMGVECPSVGLGAYEQQTSPLGERCVDTVDRMEVELEGEHTNYVRLLKCFHT